MLASGLAHAAKADREEKIHIQADQGNFDQKTNTGVYIGNVIVTQGSMVLRSDKLTIRQDADGNQFSQGQGNPVKFRERGDDGTWITAEALRYDYNGQTGLLTLIDKANVHKDQDEVIGDIITYNLNTDQYEAKTTGKSGGRVNITITPKKKASAPAAAARPAATSASEAQ
ncbi:lipopolysaccharide ABC transporter substrate-binding protein LptA [Silvimonas sp. JCM 19000]